MGIIQAMRKWQGLPTVSNPTDLGLPSQCTSNDIPEEFLQ